MLLAVGPACERPEQSRPTVTDLARHWPLPPGAPDLPVDSLNPLTEAGIALGRRLFFDPILSADSTLACAGCHRPDRAFADGLTHSIGIEKRLGRRSTPSLLNVAYLHKSLFWDGRSPDLTDQVLHSVVDSLEMAADWPTVENRLRRHASYPSLFDRAFGISDPRLIDRQWVAKALAQYERTLISFDSKFDRVMRDEAVFTPSEKRGWTIFFDAGYPETPMGECSHCHTDPLFTNQDFANNGLDEAPTLAEFKDLGRGAVTRNRYDNGQFRVPSLRNIALTAPYMHDGRFATLEAAIEHYNGGGRYAENVNPNVRPLGLSERDKRDLIAFLATLTDTSYVIQSVKPPEHE